MGFPLCRFNYRLNKLGWFYSFNYKLCKLCNGCSITTCSINTICSIWMLLITLFRLGLGSSSMLLNITIVLIFYPPPPPISWKQVCSSSSFKSIIGDPTIVIDFWFNGEVTRSRLNLSFSVSSYVHIFSCWDWCVGKGNAIVEHVDLLSFKNSSLVIGSSETYCCYATLRYQLADDTCSFGVVVFGEGNSNKGNHFINKISKISPE
jgi:hypothetical protein